MSHFLHQGQAGVTFVADYTARMIFDRAAGFLVEHGGWVGDHPYPTLNGIRIDDAIEEMLLEEELSALPIS